MADGNPPVTGTSNKITAGTVPNWKPSDVCKWVMSTGLSEQLGMHFVEHSINGELLLKLKQDDMSKIGVTSVGDEFALWDRIEVLQRVCNKPETGNLKVPSIPMRLYALCSFAFADTSEGKSLDDSKMEVVMAAGNVAIVSTLVWAIAFDIFYNSAYSTFCETNALEQVKVPLCFTSGGFDLDGWRLTLFYVFAGLCAVCLLFSTIFAVLQIIMVYEMSDEVELEIFLEKMGASTALPGIFLFLGLVMITIPITVFMVFNSLNGCYFQTLNLINDDPKYNVINLVMSYVAQGGVLLLATLFVAYWCPSFVGDMYRSKVDAMDADKALVADDFKDIDLGDDHF